MIHLRKLHRLRREFGQKKYGVGELNGGWRRDNGRDVIEELSDAIVISGYWRDRVYHFNYITYLLVCALICNLHVIMFLVNCLRSLTPKWLRQEEWVNRIPEAKEVE